MEEKKQAELREVVRLRYELESAIGEEDDARDRRSSIETRYRNAMVGFCRDWGREKPHHVMVNRDVVNGDVICVIPVKHRPGTQPDPEILFEQFETIE